MRTRGAKRTARSMAAFIPRVGLAAPGDVVSRTVTTLVRTIGNPNVTLTASPKPTSFMGMVA
jgi:hypothetical protein